MAVIDLESERAASVPVTSEPVLRGWTVLICAPEGRERLMIPEWVVDRGGLPMFARGCPEMLRALTAPGANHVMVVLVASPQCRTEDVVERCLTLRAASPQAPIVLISPNVSGNDFSADRRAMCDVVLRSPTTNWAFGTAVNVAIASSRDRAARVAGQGGGTQVDPALLPGPPEPGEAVRALPHGWWLLPVPLLGLGVWLAAGAGVTLPF